jgi:hypothetical protein
MSAPSPPIISNSIPRSSPGMIEFWWEGPVSGPVTGYKISCDGLFTDQDVGNVGEAAFTGLTDNQRYQFSIKAYNGSGDSAPAYWPIWEAGTPSGPPTNINGQFTPDPNVFVVSVTPPVTSNVLEYYWAKGTPVYQTNSNDYIGGTQYASTTTIPVQEFNPDRAYNFEVRAFSPPGWSQPSTESLQYARVSGCFITNATVAMPFGGIDTDSDQVVILAPRVAGVPVTLYNRFGKVVQTFSDAETAANVTIIAYISADGCSNLWMARIISNGLTFFGSIYIKTLFDSNGNAIIPLNIFGNVTVYDKTGATIASLTSPGSLTQNFYGYILKFSPSGIWAGANDPNTWVTRFIISGSVASTNHRTAINGLTLDANDNILVQGQAFNFAFANQTVTVQDQNQATIGTAFIIPGPGISYLYGLVIKFASNGLFTNSWRAYITGFTGTPVYANCIQANQYGQVIVATRYRDPTPQVIGSDNNVIGTTLPFTSSINGSTETVLIRFCSTGVASASWRAPIYSSSIHTFSKNDIPFNVILDSNDNIYLTGFSESGPPGVTIVPLFVCASNDSTFLSTATLGNNNIYVTKYNNSGQPLWVTLLKGTNTSIFTNNTNFTIPTNNGNVGTTPQNLQTFLDNQNNFTLVGVYSRAPFDVLNRNQQTVFTTPVPGNTLVSSFGATYVVKYVNDASNAYTSILNVVSTPGTTQTNVPIGYVRTANDELILFQQSMTTVFPAFVNIPIGIYGYNGSSTINANPDLSTFTTNIGLAGYQYIVKYTSSLSTIAMAQIQQSNAVIPGSVFGGGSNQAGGYIGLTSTNDVVVSGIYQNSIRVFDFGSDSSSFFLQSTSISNCQGLYVARLTGTPSNSWVGQTTIAGSVGAPNNSNTLIQKFGTFFTPTPFQVNQTTNQIYTGGYTLSSVYTLFDGYTSSITTMGFQSTNLSNVTFFTCYPSDGRFSLS